MKISKYRRFLAATLMSGFCLLGLTSCNLFSSIDSPSGDIQILSAARACLDSGDFACAKNYYNQLSNNDNDIKQSELAYTDLEQIGIGMQQFAAAFGNGKNISIGTALTSLANSLIAIGPNQALRVRIFNDFANEAQMTSGSSLQALVRFLVGTTFAAEILAEAAVTVGSNQLLQSDIATAPAACSASAPGGASCTAPAGATIIGSGAAAGLLPDGKASLDAEAVAATTAGINTSTTPLNMFLVSLTDVNNGITTLGQSGVFGSNFSTFLTAFKSLASDQAVRSVILSNGIGN